MADAVNERNPGAATTTTYAHPLDAQAYNGNDLGAVYSRESTTFKVWAPTATQVAVRLYATGSSDEAGAQELSTTAMEKEKNGVWSATLKGDKKNQYYTYLVTVDGVTRETADIYGKAAGVNGNRSMVVDLDETDPDGWEKDKHVLYDDPTDAVVWEVHVRDFSSSEVSGISLKHRGKYLAFTEKGTTVGDKGEYSTCIDYLKKLGVTHVQLLPVYDYATVDESDTTSDQFNWGYDPKNYNVPEGSYSTDPFHGSTRITEFKQMIMALHEAGIGVIMDVVYNHTFTAPGGWFEMTVPGYYYRMNADGSFSDGSACGNETASDHLMYRKYMIDSILYWTTEYHIDGFRFDLMGVHDVTTMNEIRKALDQRVINGSKIIMYGEPWTGGPLATDEPTAVKNNIRLLDKRIGAFNDDFRDSVKGHVFNALEKGFVQDGSSTPALKKAIAANCLNGGWAGQPSQSIAYTSAHDNFTLYDKLVLSVKNDGSFTERDEQLIGMNRLAAAITMTSQGINFMQAGEEFARTKQGDENSYISSTAINLLDWNTASDNADLVSYYAGLIEVRKHFKPFRDPSTTSAELITFSETDKGVVAYTLENTLTGDKEWKHAAVLFNALDTEQTVTLTAPAGKTLPKSWTVIVNQYEAGLNKLGTVEGGSVTIPPCSALVLVDQDSFEKLAVSSDACTVRVDYKDKSSGKVLNSRVYKGTAGSAYTAVKDASLDLAYDFASVEGKTEGKFTKDIQTVTFYYEQFKGKIVNLTVNYLEEIDEILGGGSKEAAPAVTMKLRQDSPYSAVVKMINGMEPDLTKFPANALGTAADEDIVVNYYYKPLPQTALVLHYFNSAGWDRVTVRVYQRSDEGTVFTAEQGDVMQPDKTLGDGWYTLSLPDIGTRENLYASFGNGADQTDTHFGTVGCKVQGEVWINGAEVTHNGKVTVLHLKQDGTVLDTQVLTAQEGTPYTTSPGSFKGLDLVANTANTNGVYSEMPLYVIYQYDVPAANAPNKTLALCLGISAVAAAAAAAVLFVLSRKRK